MSDVSLTSHLIIRHVQRPCAAGLEVKTPRLQPKLQACDQGYDNYVLE